ncbi:hypothetical protein D3C78_1044150 [compost metagenome]
MRAEHQIDAATGPLQLAGFAVAGFITVVGAGGRLPFHAHVQQVLEEVVGQRSWPFGEHTLCVLPDIVAQHPQAADQHGHLRRAEVQQLRLVDQQRLGFGLGPGFDEVAKTIGNRLEQTERLHIGLFLRGVGTAWGEGHGEVVASVFRRLLHTRVTR